MGKVGVPLLVLGVDRQVTKRDPKGRDGLLSVHGTPPVLGAGLNGRLLCLWKTGGAGVADPAGSEMSAVPSRTRASRPGHSGHLYSRVGPAAIANLFS